MKRKTDWHALAILTTFVFFMSTIVSGFVMYGVAVWKSIMALHKENQMPSEDTDAAGVVQIPVAEYRDMVEAAQEVTYQDYMGTPSTGEQVMLNVTDPTFLAVVLLIMAGAAFGFAGLWHNRKLTAMRHSRAQEQEIHEEQRGDKVIALLREGNDAAAKRLIDMNRSDRY